MKAQSSRPQPCPGAPSRRPGFTLVELLVTIVIVAILVTMAFVFTRRASFSANKAADLNNVRQLAVMSLAMASDSNGNLPVLHPKSNPYPYHFTLEARRNMETNGLAREKAYANTRDLLGGKPNYTWWTFTPTTSVFHYVYFADDSRGGTPWWGDGSSVKKPTTEEFRGDRMILQTNRVFARNLGDQPWYPLLWGSLCREYEGNLLCSAMDSGRPGGINAVYLDGSASWIPKEKLNRRLNAGKFALWW